jgi:hypothetical protein
VKLAAVARTAVPAEEVVAFGLFRAGGIAPFAARGRERQVRRSSGLGFKRYLLLVLTPERLHAFDARARTGWKVEKRLATWDRSAVRTFVHPQATTRLTVDVPAEGRRLELEGQETRGNGAGELARLLALDSLAPAPAPVPDPWAPPVPVRAGPPEEPGPSKKLHGRVAMLAILGGGTRLLAYFLPWVVLSRPGFHSISISGMRVLGTPAFSLAYSVAAIVVGVLYLRGQRESSTRLLFWFGVSAVVVFFLQLTSTMSGMEQARAALGSRLITARLGFGVFVEAAGAVLVLLAGVTGSWASTRSPSPAPTYAAPASKVRGNAGV